MAEDNKPRKYVKLQIDLQEGDDCFCRCPICKAQYRAEATSDGSHGACCKHLITDWCFTADIEPGYERGYFATPKGSHLLVEIGLVWQSLRELLWEHEWPSEADREGVLNTLPEDFHQDHRTPESSLLLEQVLKSPGYLGTHSVETNSMASDAWSVHWGEDGNAAARAMEPEFERTLELLTSALSQAKSLMKREAE